MAAYLILELAPNPDDPTELILELRRIDDVAASSKDVTLCDAAPLQTTRCAS